MDWFASYLSNRKQFVCIDGECSESNGIEWGIPQGSVLSPLQYLLYTDRIGDIIKKHNLWYHLYADDTQLYCSFQSSNAEGMSNSRARVESCIKDIQVWMSLNKLKLKLR